MKDRIKSAEKVLFLELMLFSALIPYVDVFNNVRSDGFRWAWGYLFFFAAVIAAMFIERPVLFFPVWIACSAADFALDRVSVLFLAAVPVSVWALYRLIIPMNRNYAAEKKDKTRIIAVNAAFAVIAAAVIAVSIFVMHKTGVQGFRKKMYITPWAAIALYYAYGALLKGGIVPVESLKRKLKKEQ